MTIGEFANQVAVWHQETFGLCATSRVLQKLDEEFGEFWDNPSDDEASDVIICLFAWSFRNGGDLQNALLQKFETVKARTDQIERDAERGIVG